MAMLVGVYPTRVTNNCAVEAMAAGRYGSAVVYEKLG